MKPQKLTSEKAKELEITVLDLHFTGDHFGQLTDFQKLTLLNVFQKDKVLLMIGIHILLVRLQIIIDNLSTLDHKK